MFLGRVRLVFGFIHVKPIARSVNTPSSYLRDVLERVCTRRTRRVAGSVPGR